MKIIFISGNGHGAGKTYLAKKIASGDHQIFSIANMIRNELQHEYPKYDWHNKEPKHKIYTIVSETKKSIHEMLIERGQDKKNKNSLHWAQELIKVIKFFIKNKGLKTIIIDDLRYFDEFEYIKRYFQDAKIIHFHVYNPHSKEESQYENNKLMDLADYILVSQRVLKFRKLILEKID